MKSVEKIDSNAVGNPVQRTTSMKMSQTWLASQTGPIAQSINARGRRPCSPPPGEQAPDAGAEVRAAEDGVHRRNDEEDDGDGVGFAHAGVPAGPGAGPDSGPYGTSSRLWSSCRQRRDIARREMISVAPSAT